MRQITKFQANDGSEFLTEKECQDWEIFLLKAAAVDQILPKKELNSTEFIQHSPTQFHSFLVGIAKLIEVRHGHEYANMLLTNRHGYIGRYLDDSGDRVLGKLMYRLLSIDNKNREWQQVYFANEANKKDA